MTPELAVIGLCLFAGLLSLGAGLAELVLTTPAHRDARRRNPRRADLPEAWWRG